MNVSDEILDLQTRARIFADRVVPESGLSLVASHDRPTAIILGGQPGAGKGVLARAAVSELQGDSVLIDPDELREFHPDVERLRSTFPYT